MMLKAVIIGVVGGMYVLALNHAPHELVSENVSGGLVVTQTESHGAYPRTGFGMQAAQSTVSKVQNARRDYINGQAVGADYLGTDGWDLDATQPAINTIQ